ncbi:MAG: pyridoxal phosphate-dependent aminotransferase [Candidatus Omnitrophica bacterium]|nr:pyridoxal phosphate-dependent aminotransferase [Candidatus Omnitrophota bacterium]
MRLAARIMNVGESSTLAITAEAKKMKKEGIDVVSFGAGEPDFDTPKNIKEAAKKAIDEGVTKYTPSGGTPELKEAIAAKLLTDNKLEYKPSQIVVSCGAKHSIYNIIQVLCQKGDEVLIPSPYWVSYPEMVKLAEATPVFIPTRREDNFKLTRGALKKAITKKTRLLILNSPSNPTGAVYNEEELFFISELAVEKGIYVLSDEIYEKLLYDGSRHISIASFNKKIYDLTILVNGVSKTYSMTGWRIGYLAAHQEIASAVENLQSHSTSNPASMCQKAALEAISGNQDFIREMVDEFKKRRDYMAQRLADIKGFSPFVPRGAFYIFCDISCTGIKSVELAGRLLSEARVAVIPGEGFGWNNQIRLSFATGMETIKKGMDRIEEWARQ